MTKYAWGCLFCDWELSGSSIPVHEGNMALIGHPCGRTVDPAKTTAAAKRERGEHVWTAATDNMQ